MMSLWDALRMNMMISYQELVRTFPNFKDISLNFLSGSFVKTKNIPSRFIFNIDSSSSTAP
ncbi:hypothetical protein CEO50_29780 [Klebsiella pneumoniae]|nr:hypothetical protein CEO50_29780 [Klebsiella pneumoniae]